jgi:hypothetical protein
MTRRVRVWTRGELRAAGLLLGLSAAGSASAQTPPPPAAADCGDAPSVQGSKWDLVEESRLYFRPNVESCEFRSGGKLIHQTPTGAFEGGWTQRGGCVDFDQSQFGDKISEWKGTIKGDRMEGVGLNMGEEFTWALVRRGGAAIVAPSGGGLVRRAFAPGGPEALVRTGRASYTRLEEGEEIQSFSFTTDASGKLLSAGAERPKTVKQLYDVTLFLDEAGARQALAKWKAKDLRKQLGRNDIHEAVLAGAFDKLVLVTFSRPWSAQELRQDFVESLGARTSLDDPAVVDFTKCVARDFKAGDEMVIRVSQKGALLVTAGSDSCAEIASLPLSRAVLGIWIGKQGLSGQPGGLLSAAGPLMKR